MSEKPKKKFFQKWWFWVIVAFLFIIMIANCGDNNKKTTSDTDTKAISTEEEVSTKTYTQSEITSILIESTADDVGEGEIIDFISFEEDDVLTISVDISATDPSPLTYDLLAESRAGSITDTILEYPEFDDYWTSVVVDFGGYGYYEGTKSMIVENEYGMRYFDFPLAAVSSSETESDSDIPLGMRNALSKAQDYLAYTSFSESGLYIQLEYEGYTSEECEYGVSNCGADWYEQSALKALEYLAYSAFSENGLIEQLEYEGFTNDEAVYGVDNCGADWSEQAVLKAQEYLDYSAFSKSGLIDQLEYEGFTSEQAKYGVENCGEDW